MVKSKLFLRFFMVLFFLNSTAMSNSAIDVIIPCHEKDCMVLGKAIEGVRQYVPDVGRVIVISSKKLNNKAEWLDEKRYPFSKRDVLHAMFCDNEYFFKRYENNFEACRVGWVYQQLLKFYAPFVVPGLSENVLIVDADTVFLNPVTFFDEEGNALYAYRKLRFIEYKKHASRLVPSIIDRHPDIEGIAHHILLQKSVLGDLFAEVEAKYKRPFWKAFCNCIDQSVVRRGGRVRASEYEIYFSYIFSVPGHYKVKVRELIAADVGSMSMFDACKKRGFAFASCQAYLRSRPNAESPIP